MVRLCDICPLKAICSADISVVEASHAHERLARVNSIPPGTGSILIYLPRLLLPEMLENEIEVCEGPGAKRHRLFRQHLDPEDCGVLGRLICTPELEPDHYNKFPR